MKDITKRAAEFIYYQAAAGTNGGSWAVYQEELEDVFEMYFTRDDLEEVADFLGRHPGVAEVEVVQDMESGTYIDLCLWLSYCGINEEE